MMEELEALLKGQVNEAAPMAMANSHTMASAMCGIAHAICIVHDSHGQPSGKFINLFRDTQKLCKRITKETNRQLADHLQVVPDVE